MAQIADNRAQTLGITIRSILEANLETTSKNNQSLRQIADNRAQTQAITNCCILEANLKTTSKKQQKFGTNS